jgi:phospho-N-acetylmuramoyl-pentapeptide-transferase
MFYYGSAILQSVIPALHVFHYVSFRAMAAFISVVITSILSGDWCIKIAQKLFRSKSREHTPERHRLKDDMPTMGGIFVVANILLTAIFWCSLVDVQVALTLLCLFLFGIIGLYDDWMKITAKRGISERTKFMAQIIAATFIVMAWQILHPSDTTIVLPIFKEAVLTLPWPLITLWRSFIIVGVSNAVNLTDGLDGLAIGSLIPNFATFAIIAYLAGHAGFAAYLHIPFAGTAELAIIAAILVGASLGFLWFNAHPAQIFMGDVGSLSLGAALGCIAIMVRQELLLIVSGLLFVVETLSVIAQVISFRWYGKRLFRMAPIHHHFELLGWPESKIVTRFGIITSIMCLITLMLLKIR